MIYFFTEKPASKSRRRATTDVEGLLERFGAVLSGDISADATEKENFYTALREGTKERGMVFMAWLQLCLSLTSTTLFLQLIPIKD